MSSGTAAENPRTQAANPVLDDQRASASAAADGCCLQRLVGLFLHFPNSAAPMPIATSDKIQYLENLSNPPIDEAKSPPGLLWASRSKNLRAGGMLHTSKFAAISPTGRDASKSGMTIRV